MRAKLLTIALTVLLLVSTFTVGFVLAVGAQRQGKAPSGAGGGGPPAPLTTPQSIFVVKAMGVSPQYVYPASLLKKIPPYMLAPLQGLAVVIAGLEPFGTARRGLPYNNQLVTNSSGIGEGGVPAGNYTIRTVGSDSNFSTTVGFREGMITILTLTVTPLAGNVSTLLLINQDTLSGVQPTADLYATVKGNFGLSASTFTELLGLGPTPSRRPSAPSPLLTIDLTVLGTYPSPEGTVVAMRPQAAYSFLPKSGLTLIQFRTNSTVNYVGL
jgi:hypothetical protein